MSGRKNSIAALFLATCVFACAAHAAEDDVDHFALSPEQLLDATVISVSKTSEKVMDAPAAVFILSNEDIKRSGTTSIPEALRLVPGIEVAQVNANSWAISARGFNGTLADKLLVLVDGRAVYDPLFSGVYWDIQDMVLEDIERIEVVRGPGGTLWGDNAVNGVINIITKKASDTQGNLASLTMGNKERGLVEERYGGQLDNGYYRVYGKYTNRDGEDSLTGNADHDGWQAGHGGFRADLKSADSSKDDFTVQGDMYHSDAGQLRFFPVVAKGTDPLIPESIVAQGANILGRWTHAYAEDSRLTVQSYVDFTSRNQLLIEDRRTSFDFDAQYEMPSYGRHKIITGAGYRYSADGLTGSQDVSFFHKRENDQTFNTFLQDKITLEPKTWFLTLGSKLERNNYDGTEIQPNARLQWHPDEQQMVWAAISRAVRTPSRLEQDLHIIQTAVPNITLDTLPNANFTSESVVAYETGYRRQLTPKASVDVALFYNDYSKLSTLTSEGLLVGTNPTHLIIALEPTNSTQGETHGVEITGDWHVLDNLKFSSSYSFLYMALEGPISGSLGAETAEQQSPSHQFNFRSQWDVTKNISYDTTLYYVSDLPAFAVPGYTRLDMRLGWRAMEGLEFALVGQNLLESAHQEFTAPNDSHTLATKIGRSVFGQCTWQF